MSDLKRLEQAALTSDYAYKQVAHLANNIGPRLTGSAQAGKAVEYVASELKTIGCDVQLEKVMVPHWVRAEEAAALVQFPGMAEGTTQKIIVTALGAIITARDALPRVETLNVASHASTEGAEVIRGRGPLNR